MSEIGLSTFQHAVRDLDERSRAIDIRQFEPPTCSRPIAELHATSQALVHEATELASRIVSACEQLRTASGSSSSAAPDPFLPFDRAVDVAVDSPAQPLHVIEDLAFLIHLELRQRAARLERAASPGSQLANVIGECDSALRCIRKGLTALDVAIARHEGSTPMLGYSSELEDALSIRRAYAKFRRRIHCMVLPREGDIHNRMRAAGTTIAVLVGWNAYSRLRVRDRLHLRDLQQRILAWLHPQSPRDIVDGQRILEDLASFVELLKLINRRQELIAHDGAALTALVSTLRHGPGDEISPEARDILVSLQGLDDELDDAAQSPAAGARRVLEVATEAARRLGCDLTVKH